MSVMSTSLPPSSLSTPTGINIVAMRKKSDSVDPCLSSPAPASASASSASANPETPVSSKKPHLKEKITQMYECLVRGDDTDRHSTFGTNFWAEFFLLRPKISVLEAEIGKVWACESTKSTKHDN